MHEFIKVLIPITEHFPRYQKQILGRRLEEKILDLLDLLIDAYYGVGKSKKSKLYTANLAIEKLRHLLRITYEQKYINPKKLDMLMEQLYEIGSMVGGWIKSLK